MDYWMCQPLGDKKEFRQERSPRASSGEAETLARATLRSARHPPVLISQDVELQDPSENRRLARQEFYCKPETGCPFRLLVFLRPKLLVIAGMYANGLAKPLRHSSQQIRNTGAIGVFVSSRTVPNGIQSARDDLETRIRIQGAMLKLAPGHCALSDRGAHWSPSQ